MYNFEKVELWHHGSHYFRIIIKLRSHFLPPTRNRPLLKRTSLKLLWTDKAENKSNQRLYRVRFQYLPLWYHEETCFAVEKLSWLTTAEVSRDKGRLFSKSKNDIFSLHIYCWVYVHLYTRIFLNKLTRALTILITN